MKKFLTLLLFLTGAFGVYAQAPQAVCYQAVATDASGVELTSATIGVRAAIVQGSMNGTTVWQETHSPATDDFGLFNLDVGTGTRVGGTALEFEDIDWGAGPYFLRIEMDAAGGTNYAFMGANQILSVPYALYSDRSGFAAEAGNATTANTANTAIFADTALYVTNSVNSVSSDTALVALTSLDDFDTDPQNEIQSLTYDTATNELGITNDPNGATVTLNVEDDDADATNEIQSLVYDMDTNELGITNDPNGATISLNVNDADADATNEIQQLSLEDNILTLSNPQGADSAIDLDDIGFGRPGASADFPLGIIGEHVVVLGGTYVVPDGKEFFITAGPPSLKFRTADGTITTHPTTPNMPVFGPATEVIDCMCTGFLADSNPIVEAVVIKLTNLTDVYTVPSGKILFVKSGLENSNISYLKVNGVDLEFLRPNFTRGTRIMSFPEGTTIAVPSTSGITQLVLTAYTIDSDL